MVVEQTANQVAIHRGNLLKLSEFLCSFAHEYKVENGPITPDDIDDAFEFAGRKKKHKCLEEVYYHWKRDWHDDDETLTANLQKKWDNLLRESNASVDSVSNRARHIYVELQRFEVWSIKALALKNLLPAGNLGENTEKPLYPACWSSLLNLPGACHFAKILPEKPGSSEAPNDIVGPTSPTGEAGQPDDNQNNNLQAHESPCFLALPPNTLTSREYLRLVRMLGVLPDDSSRLQVANSPLTWVQKAGVGLTDSFRFTAPDLLALWIRGQRNTFALRHLWQIFSFAEQELQRPLTIRGTSGSGKCLVPVQATDQHDEEIQPRKFIAKLVGNSRKTRARILNESSLVDELVTWAVINEVMCTFHHLRAMIKSRLTLRKRRLSGLYRNSRKRRRIEQNNPEAEESIRKACLTYVLRWFARRHLDTLAVLFLSKPASLARSNVLVRKMCKACIPQEIESKIGDDNKSFARIDRNIACGKFQTCDQFHDAVNNLLQAMGSSMTPDLLASDIVQNIIADFDEMYEMFLDGKDPAQSASLLLDPTAMSPELNLAELLQSLPAPWADECLMCSETIKTFDAVVCACCGRSYHSDCCEKWDITKCQTWSLIRKLWTFHVPPSLLPGPDFRENVKWTTVNVTIKREAGKDGTLPKLGLNLLHTEECIEFYDQLLSGKLDLSEPRAHKHLKPLCIEQKGCLVTAVHSEENGCGKAAGIQRGDVIVGVEFRSFLDPGIEAKYLPRRLHSFAKLSQRERLELFRRPATEMRVLIERPNMDILQHSIAFLEQVRRVNEPMSQAMAVANSTTWCCGGCLDRQRNEEYGSLPIVIREAILARSFLRCLGADSYAVPLHDEEIWQDPDEHRQTIPMTQAFTDSSHVSLRRLDGMMTSIIARQANAPESDDPLLAIPFNRPPWSKTEKDARLDWAPKELELKPFELLCRGLRLLVSAPSDFLDGGRLEERKLLARNFVVLFSSWCTSLSGDSQISNPGPPLGAFCARVPWIRDCCSFCQVRAGVIASEASEEFTFRVCGSQACRAILDAELSRRYPEASQRLKSKNSSLPLTSTDLALLEYEEFSSYVGATVLILPGDPVLLSVQDKLGFNIEHSGRVVEFIVASYLPGDFHKSDAGDRTDASVSFDDDDGIFHLLPVLSQHQLQFLLPLCKMRKALSDQASVETEWLALDVLNLNGVLSLSPKELRRRLDETLSMSSALERTIEATIDATYVNKEDVDVSHVWPGKFLKGLSLYETLALPEMENVLRCTQVLAKDDGIIFDKVILSSILCEMIEMMMSCLGRCGLEDELQVSNALCGVCESDVPDNGDEITNNAQMTKGLGKSRADPTCKCKVEYSDFYFPNEAAKLLMQKALRKQQPTVPQPTSVSFQSLSLSDPAWRTVVLDREESSKATIKGGYNGPGWGLELLSWPNVDPNVRVGRVHPLSPAAAAGLTMNDIVVSINGHDVCGRREFVARAMMNLLDSNKTKLSMKELPSFFKNPRNAPLTPVVLVVFRPQSASQVEPLSREATGNLLESQIRETESTVPHQRPVNSRLAQTAPHSHLDDLLSPHTGTFPASQDRRTDTYMTESPSAESHSVPAFQSVELAESQTFSRMTQPLPRPFTQNKSSTSSQIGTLTSTQEPQTFSSLTSLPLAFRLDASGVNSLVAVPKPRDCTQSGLITYHTFRGGNSQVTSPSRERISGEVRRMNLNDRVQNVPASPVRLRVSSTDSREAGKNALDDVNGTTPLDVAEPSSLHAEYAAVAWNEAWNACSTLLLRIYATVHESYQMSRVLSQRDLYRVSIPQAIFTNPEASLLLESARRRMPMVGLAIISLRYDVTLINWQLMQLIGRDLSSIPQLPGGLWNFLLLKDKQRKSESESILPIDRLAESFLTRQHSNHERTAGLTSSKEPRISNDKFRGEATENATINSRMSGAVESHHHIQIREDPHCRNDASCRVPLYNEQISAGNLTTLNTEAIENSTSVQFREAATREIPINGNETDLARIRGGGGDQMTRAQVHQSDGRKLCECPYDEWPKKLVSGVCDLLTDDGTNQTAKFIGFVVERCPDERERSADSVRVSVIYLSSEDVSSYLEDEEQVVSGSMLHLVEEGSDEERIAQTWWELRADNNNKDNHFVDDSLQKHLDNGALHHSEESASLSSSKLAGHAPIDGHADREPNTISEYGAHEVYSTEAEDQALPLTAASPPTPELKEIENPKTHLSATETVADQDPLSSPPSQGAKSGSTFVYSRSDAENKHLFVQGREHIEGREFESSKKGLCDTDDKAASEPRQVRDSDASLVDFPLHQPQACERVDNSTTILPYTDKPSTIGEESQAELYPCTVSTIEAAGYSLLEYLKTFKGSLSLLGDLPDGRQVFWFRSDPERLYLKNPEESSKALLLSFHENCFRRDFSEDIATSEITPQSSLPAMEKFCCLWGCARQDISSDTSTDLPILGFDTIADLGAHIAQHHFIDNQAEQFSFDSEECLFRISGGNAVLQLIVDLTGAICSRYPSLQAFTEVREWPKEFEETGHQNHSSAQESFILFRIGDIWEHASGVGRFSGQIENVIKGSHHSGKRLRELLSLWVKIFLLSNTNVKRDLNAGKQVSLTGSDGCDTDRLPSGSRRQGFCCKDCCAPAGLFQSRNFQPTLSQKSFVGVGGALLSDSYQSKVEPAQLRSLRENAGLLGVAQALLIRVAENLPDAFKNSDAAGGNLRERQSLIFPLWTDSNFEIWRDFVVGCSGSRSLAQGFLILVSSIKKSLLPAWWANSGIGWFSPQNLMYKPTLSKVLLHLIVFDAAVAEFLLADVTKNNDDSDNVPKSLASFPLEDRMALVANWADELNVPRFEGAYSSFCCKCDDGGDLLCCEYCNAVQHAGCCSPQLSNDPVVFVCSVCISDIAALHEPLI